MSQAAESTLPYYPFEVRVYDAEIIIAELVQEIEAVEIEHMHALTRALEEMGEGKKWKVVTVIHNYSLLDTKAREYASSEYAQRFTIANAIVVTSLATRIGANFFINFSNAPRPTKIFNKTEMACEWLKKISSAEQD